MHKSKIKKSKDKRFLVYVAVVLSVVIIFLVLKVTSTENNNIPFVKKDISILFVGDMMFDRNVATHAKKYGKESLFSGAKDILSGHDLVVGNLEGTITDNKSIAQVDRTILHFTFEPLYADLLREYNFSFVSLANNHSTDFFADGYKQTKANLKRVGIGSFGSAYNDTDISTSTMINGKNICLVGYHDLYTGDSEPALKEIARISPSCDRTVVFAHWGNEYETFSSERQSVLAHDFIDAGADLIIGAHPHVVQPVEIYKNKAIFYSLGNFMFDQYFSFDTTHSFALNVSWDGDKTNFYIIPVSLIGTEVKKVEGESAKALLINIVAAEILDEKIRSSILDNKMFTLIDQKSVLK